MLFRSSLAGSSRVARARHSLAFPFKMSHHKGERDTVLAFLVLVLAPNWPEGDGPPEMKARRHFPVICIRNERSGRIALPLHSTVIACVSRYSALRRLVAPALDKRRTNPNIITRREASPWNWYSNLRAFPSALLSKELDVVTTSRNVTCTARNPMLARTERNKQRKIHLRDN